MSDDLDATLNGWLLNPSSNLVLFLSDEMLISGLIQRSLMFAETAPAFMAFMKANLPRPQEDLAEAVGRLLDLARTDASFAQHEVKSGFIRVLSHHAVATWAAIETAIEQTLINHVRKVPDARNRILKSAPKLKDTQVRTTTEKEAKNTLRIWEQALPETSVIGRMVLMLDAFGAPVAIPESNKRALSELAEMRNIILHRGGRADQRFIEKCPWTKLKPGDQVTINVAAMEGYFDSAKHLAIGLMAAMVKSPFIQATPKADDA